MQNKKPLSDFRPASRNSNLHTRRGMALLEKSIRRDGWIGAMTASADGELIAGSARIEQAAEIFGVDIDPIVIESDGSRPILVIRKDIPSANDPRAQRLAIADNRIGEIDLSWDLEVLTSMDAPVLAEMFTPEELHDFCDNQVPDFQPVGVEEQGQLDKQKAIVCPNCGHEFYKR